MLDPIRAKTRFVGFTAAAFLGGLLLAAGLESTTDSQASALPFQAEPQSEEVRAVADLSNAFISISESVTPAVVNIRAERRARGRQREQIPEPFREFFRMPPGGQGEGELQPSGGTGFLISDDGYIMTNNHVVADAENITVTLSDRRELRAEVIGRDASTDIAVIQVEGNDFPTARLGNSDDIRVGEWVLAMGNPLMLENTVTAGIVSALDRTIQILGQGQPQEQAQWTIEGFIQTDAAINPGNSGGPLVNLRGEVIGVNTAIASETGRSAGYGFAVPIDLARRVANDLVQHGRWRRAVLGVSTVLVTSEDAEVYGLPAISGARVAGFQDGSPAERAGVRDEDVIVGVDGQTVGTTSQLQRRIAAREPGETITLNIVRFGDRQDIEVRLDEIPGDVASVPERTRSDDTGQQLGFRITELTPQAARRYGYNEAGGVVISQVQERSQAFQRGVREGMKVTEAQRQAVENTEGLREIIERTESGQVLSLRLEDPSGQSVVANLRVPRG